MVFVGLGMMFVLLSALWNSRLDETFAQGTVLACQVVNIPHMTISKVSMVDGRVLELKGGSDYEDASRCVPVGATVEKRPGEYAIRINGELQYWPLLPTKQAFFWGGTVLIIFGVGGGLVLAARGKSPKASRECDEFW